MDENQLYDVAGCDCAYCTAARQSDAPIEDSFPDSYYDANDLDLI